MNFRISKKNLLLFLGFFFIIIGNGKYIYNRFSNSFEYIGILILTYAAITSIEKKHRIRKAGEGIILCLALSVGAFVLDTSIKTRTTILITSFLMVVFTNFSGGIACSLKSLKVLYKAILFGIISTILIGIATGTLGLTFGAGSGFVGMTFLSGFLIKNYCGGIWLVLFIVRYIVASFEKNIKKNSLVLLTIIAFILLSGSKGAFILCLIFVACINFTRIVNIKNKYKLIFYGSVSIIAVACGILIYRNILTNVHTYAYRIRGMQSTIEIMLSDIKRLLFGMSDIAYAETGYDYTVNMRTFLGWESSVEMAYLNILIKNGLIGCFAYAYIFLKLFRNGKNCCYGDLVRHIIILLLLSGLVETYIVTIHYAVGPILYCVVNGLIKANEKQWTSNRSIRQRKGNIKNDIGDASADKSH